MQFVEEESNRAFSRLRIEHKKEVVYWDLSLWQRSQKNLQVDSVFYYLNEYLKSLPEKQQRQIFEVYQDLREIMDSVVDPRQLHGELSKGVETLYSLLSYDRLKNFTKYKVVIRTPSTIKESYEELEISERGKDFKETTYLREEYLELVNTAIYLKAMIPIWSEYINILNRVSKKDRFKEHQALILLKRSGVLNLPGIQRFLDYIEAIVSAEKSKVGGQNTIATVVGGLGSSEVSEWLMANTIIRKLVVTDLSSFEDSNNVVSVLYHHIHNTMNSLNKKFMTSSGQAIRSKHKPRGEEDEEKSFIETYKVKQEISDGDLVVLSVFTENVQQVQRLLDPTVPAETVELCLNQLRQQTNFQITQGQLTLLKWVLARVIPPKSIENIHRHSLMICLGVAQATLWHWGFPTLAALLTAGEYRDEEGNLVGGMEIRSRIPRDYLEAFNELYPCYPERGTQRESRPVNVAVRSIEELSRSFCRCDWAVYAPQELQDLVAGIDEQHYMSAPSDLKHQFSSLVYFLNTGQLTIAKE